MDGIVDDDTSWEPSAKLRYDATENDDDDDDDEERSWFSSPPRRYHRCYEVYQLYPPWLTTQ